jgi:anti-sigma factor RsiW
MMTEPCEEYRLPLEALVDGELSGDEAGMLKQHIAGCEGCATYRAELIRLSDALGRLDLRQDVPDVTGAVVRGARHQVWARFGAVACGVLVLKLLDVLGVFGTSTVSGLIVAIGVAAAFCFLNINPFRLVRPEEILRPSEPVKGVSHAS